MMIFAKDEDLEDKKEVEQYQDSNINSDTVFEQ